MVFLKETQKASACLDRCVHALERGECPQKSPRKSMEEWEEFYRAKAAQVPKILEERRRTLTRKRYVALQLKEQARAIRILLFMGVPFDRITRLMNECTGLDMTPAEVEGWVKRDRQADLLGVMALVVVVSVLVLF